MKESVDFDDSTTAAEESFWANGEQKEDFALREGPPSDPKSFDLEERTAKFGEEIITFAKKIPENSVTSRLKSQLVGAGTSVGANYCEAADCVSKKISRNPSGLAAKNPRKRASFLE